MTPPSLSLSLPSPSGSAGIMIPRLLAATLLLLITLPHHATSLLTPKPTACSIPGCTIGTPASSSHGTTTHGYSKQRPQVNLVQPRAPVNVQKGAIQTPVNEHKSAAKTPVSVQKSEEEQTPLDGQKSTTHAATAKEPISSQGIPREYLDWMAYAQKQLPRTRTASPADVSRSEVEVENGAVASDEGRCSAIGRDILKGKGGNAVDAAIATVLCAGVLNPVASGIGGGAFMLIRMANGSSEFIDFRETAPGKASEDMYNGHEGDIGQGALSIAVPGELRGLHVAWSHYGTLPWSALFQPAINLASQGFQVSPYLGAFIQTSAAIILADPGLRSDFAPGGVLLQEGEICIRAKLGETLKRVAEEGPGVLYGGDLGQKLVEEVQALGGILTIEDLRGFSADVLPAVEEKEVFGFTMLTAPPPSGGGASIVEMLKIMEGFKLPLASEGPLGWHRMVESMKHAFAMRMELGDPSFVNVTATLKDMLSPAFAAKLRRSIKDNTTFPPSHYGRPAADGRAHPLLEQANDHGTSHTCVVDSQRNAVSVTSTVNGPWGAGISSPSTGILLNNEMADFSLSSSNRSQFAPAPAPANFIRPGKRPLSSMAPTILLQKGQLRAVVGGSGGPFIVSAVLQVILNYFVRGMSPLDAVRAPRVHHQLLPDILLYEYNHTVIHGFPIGLDNNTIEALARRGHTMLPLPYAGVAQMIVHDLERPVPAWSKRAADLIAKRRYLQRGGTLEQKGGILNQRGGILKKPSEGRDLEGYGGDLRQSSEGRDIEGYRGMLTAVSDPRKDGVPSGY